MAVIDGLPGVQVIICTAQGALQEYRDPDVEDDPHTTSWYVEAQSDQPFWIDLRCAKGTKFWSNCMACTIIVDGKQVAAPYLDREACRTRDCSRLCLGASMGTEHVAPYRFSLLPTTHGPMQSSSELSQMEHLGTIEIKVRHATFGDQLTCTGKLHKPTSLNRIPEKDIKGRALSHNVKYGALIEHKTKLCSSTPYRPDLNPEKTFIFHYRSLDALQTMLIVPRSPTPGPITERDPLTLTQNEIVELQRRVRSHESNITIKSEVYGNGTGIGREIPAGFKRERDGEPARPRKRACPSAGCTILELDDDGDFRESTIAGSPSPQEVIELD